ncbi:alpha-L-fucosidase [Maribacter polysaccharolyticus]|uniref:alpha-L-fucosidase n=1 Tax=Maribacter polysaccharolyticus TaxID=3020831 RepID=UPI00237F0EDA|nr:alpha-L-fucosidase [Maribacter polysaccharolyticus]MDE3742149.1 alpha-L-fucosidase [Maribacter polysaccharolyticus]
MANTGKILLQLFVVLLFTNHAFSQVKDENSQGMDEMWGEASAVGSALRDGKGRFFDESNFGMFIHWGLYSDLAGRWEGKTYYGIGEWLMNPKVANIPPKEYQKEAKEFNPSKFNAKAIAQLAKDAGMKYIIITSKHHDGFAMFDSKVSGFDIVDATPFGRDPMKELSAACHDLGLGFGFYYSHYQDWTTPGGANGPKINEDGSAASFKEYFYNKCKPQVEEICTNYGDIDFVWFDTPGGMPKEYVVELADTVRALQPNAMLCSRLGYGLGDYVSHGDMEVPPVNLDILWESCDTNNDSWSYAWYDNNFKSPKEILHRLISTVGRGGTYLFNVGPNGEGVIPKIGVQFLEQAGQWIKKYPQVVYDAGSSPWGHALPWGDVTTQGNSLFLSVFDWPQNGKLYLPGLETDIVSATIIGGKNTKELKYAKKGNWIIFDVPYKIPDSPVAVIEVKLKNEAEVDQTHGIYPNIETTILTDFAKVSDVEKKSIRWMEKFGEWKKTTQVSKWGKNGVAEWEVDVLEPGYYYLELNYKGEGRLVWGTRTDEGILVQNEQAATNKYQAYPMGILEFKTAGKHTISVSLIEGNPETSSLKSLKVMPIN